MDRPITPDEPSPPLPWGWQHFVERLCAIDCVSRVTYDAAAAAGPVVKILGAAHGTIGVRFGSGDGALPLSVATTATGEDQTTLVADYIRRLVK